MAYMDTVARGGTPDCWRYPGCGQMHEPQGTAATFVKRKESDKMNLEIDKIYNEDCLSGMQRIPDKSIDLIVCDLPYGMTANNWDVKIPLDRLWEQYHRIMKDNTAVILFGKGKFVIELANANLKEFRYAMTWDKKKSCGVPECE